MQRQLSRLPSPSMAVAFLAVLLALGGTAVALPGKNTVKKDDIAKNAVNSADIRNGSVTGRDVKDNTLTGADVSEAALGKVPSAAAADSAASAGTASNASNAGNAANLGGVAPTDHVRYTGGVPSGKTIVGAWGVSMNNATAGEDVFETVQFPVPLSTGVLADDINFGAGTADGTDADATCTGSLTNPTAPPGKVCIYKSASDDNTTALAGFVAGAGTGTNNKFGFTIRATAAAGDVDSRGSWAYTAP